MARSLRFSLRPLAALASLALSLGGCAASNAPARSGDGGPRDAGSPDASPPDAGGAPTGVCGTAAAASPLGLVAMGMDGRALVGIGAGGARRTLHRFFGDARLRGDGPSFRGWAGDGAVVAAVASAEVECGAAACPVLSEAVVVTDGNTRTFGLGPDGDFAPYLQGITADGYGLAYRYAPGTAEVQYVALDPSRAEPRAFPPGALAYDGAPPDGDGWRRVRVESESSPFTLAPAFARLDGDEVRVVNGSVGPLFGWDTRWVFRRDVDGGTVLAIAGANEVREIPLSGPLEGAELYGVVDDHAELWRGGRPLALLDLRTGRTTTLPADALPDREDASVRSWAEQGWFVVSANGDPRYRVELATGAIERLTGLLPDGARAFDAWYCSVPPHLLEGGRLVLGLRRDGASSGVFEEGDDGVFALLGRPMHDVIFAAHHRIGDTWVLNGVSGEDTFCPRLEPWEAPPAEDAVVGTHTQIVRPDGTVYVVGEDGALLHVDPTGTCALTATWGPPVTTTMLDLERGEWVTWDDLSRLSGAAPARFGPF